MVAALPVPLAIIIIATGRETKIDVGRRRNLFRERGKEHEVERVGFLEMIPTLLKVVSPYLLKNLKCFGMCLLLCFSAKKLFYD